MSTVTAADLAALMDRLNARASIPELATVVERHHPQRWTRGMPLTMSADKLPAFLADPVPLAPTDVHLRDLIARVSTPPASTKAA